MYDGAQCVPLCGIRTTSPDTGPAGEVVSAERNSVLHSWCMQSQWDSPTVALGVGARLPAYATSMGRVLLASLPPVSLEAWLADCQPLRNTPHTVTDLRRLRRIVRDVGTQGYAYVEQELELGLCSIAVPVRDRDGRVVAALNASMPYHPDAAQHALRDVLPELRAASAAVERCLPSNILEPVSL